MMRVFSFLAVVLLLLYSCSAMAGDTAKVNRVLILLNGSATMSAAWKADVTRYEAASLFINQLAERLYERNHAVELGMSVYGAQYKMSDNRCNDYRKETPYARDNRTRLALRLEDIGPKGRGSFEYAIGQVLNHELKDTARYRYSIVIVSDSGRNCGDSYCSVLGKADARIFRTYFVELSNRVAETCFDKMFHVGTDNAMDIAVNGIAQDFSPVAKHVPNWPAQPVTKQETKPAEEKQQNSHHGIANIVRENQLYTIILFVEEAGKYKRIDEVFFYGEPSKKIPLPVGKYKIAYNQAGREVASEFRIVAGMVTDVRIE